jgi:hypothetical protein
MIYIRVAVNHHYIDWKIISCCRYIIAVVVVAVYHHYTTVQYQYWCIQNVSVVNSVDLGHGSYDRV